MQKERIKVKPTIYKDKPIHVHEIEMFDGNIGIVKDTEFIKVFKSDDYNFYFNKIDGEFIRWGTGDYTKEPPKKVSKKQIELYQLWTIFWGEDVGNFKDFVRDLETDGSVTNTVPEILDFEVSDKCAGVSMAGGKASPCKFCYKSNNNNGSYMTTEDFTKVMDKMPKSLCQIALGIGNVDQPNLFDLMDVCIHRGIVPNLTLNGDRMTDEICDKLSERCGAVAVSYYDKDLTFNSIYELATVRKMSQINIHYFLSEETYEQGLQLIDDVQNDPRTKDLNAIVFLSAKIRGNAEKNNYHILSQDKYNIISQKALHIDVAVGMDSCSAFKTLISFKDEPNFDSLQNMIESCESTIYSTYINKKGIFFPCSFAQGIGDWSEGINVLECNNFLKDVWHNEKTRKFSCEVVNCRNQCKSCAIFEI